MQSATTFVATLMIAVHELLDIVAFMRTLPGDTAK